MKARGLSYRWLTLLVAVLGVWSGQHRVVDAVSDEELMESMFKEHDYAFAEARAGDEAHDIFCRCEHRIAKSGSMDLQALCPGINAQCRQSFCKPLCLRMAWHPKITVDCTKAPNWKWCPKFAAEVHEAEKAITTQFQVHVCLRHHFCKKTSHLVDWVENHSYGGHYPKHQLPIDSCKHEGASVDQMKMLCRACERVVDVSIERGECLPQFVQLHPGSLQERCLYLADVIGQQQEELKREFMASVCSCLGCCGAGKCIFRNPEEGWIESLIETTSKRISARLETDGWTIRPLTGEVV